MQDPSQGVAQPLQNHVHLISGHRYPQLPSIPLEQAFAWLREAPQVVSKTAPMSWIYVQTPADGSIWLEWISHRNVENRYPSDGYIWGDPEQSWQQEVNGYTVELLYHRVGYRPGFDHHAVHARTRYHLIAKNPAVNAAPPDSQLYIVHYHQTDPGRIMPSPQVPISPIMRQFLGERKQLEAAGRIERRDFMLHDREHWPTITLPGAQHMQQPGFYGNANMAMPQNRYPQMPGYQAGPGGPPAKRPRYSGPGGSISGPADVMPDTSIEDEENIALGDFFDHLTPREISMARFSQHHQWIEEVFSSPYATSRIIPPDLGLGLMGELKGLTEGLLEPPSLDDITRAPPVKPAKAKQPQPFTNLKQEQVDEFNRRVEAHLKEGQAEIEKMKEEHAAKMAEWKKSKSIMEAEKRLRFATWEGHEGAVPAFRVDVSATNGENADHGRPKETVEDVVKDVESLLGRKIGSHKDSTMIREGGLEKEEEAPRDHVMQDGDAPVFDGGESSAQNNEAQASTAATAAFPTEQPVPQPPAQTATEAPAAPAAAAPTMPQSQQQDRTSNTMNDTEMGDASMTGDLDFDVDAGLELEGVDFGDLDASGAADTSENNAAETAAEATAQTSAPEDQSSTTAQPTAPAAEASQLPTAEPATQQEQPAPAQQAPPPPTPAAPSDPATSSAAPAPSNPEPAPTTSTEPTAAASADPIDDSNIFDDNTFADLADMGSTGGADDDDGLIDFDGGMGLDDSAFGDAMHSMEDSAQSGGGGGDGGAGGDGQ